MRTSIIALVAIQVVGCGDGGYSSTGDGAKAPNVASLPNSDSVMTGTGGMGPQENSGGIPNVPSANGGNATGNGGQVATATGGMPMGNGGSVGTGGAITNGAGGMAIGGNPSGVAGNPSGNGGNTMNGAGGSGTGGTVSMGTGGMVATGGMPMAAGGSPGTGGMVVSAGGMVGIDLHCPPNPDPYVACEPGQYTRPCNNGVSELLVATTWDSLKIHSITSNSPLGTTVGSMDQLGYHVQAGCVGSPVTFTLPP